MSDLIDRQATIQAIDDYTKGKPLYDYPWQIIEVIRNVPSAEKTGEWENIDIIHDRKDAKITDWQQAQCSVCGKWHTKPYLYGIDLDPYCPNCGARMK